MTARPPFAVQRLDHVVIRARDCARMVRFYEDALGCAVDRRQEKFGLIQLRAGASQIDLVDVEGAIGREGGAPPGDEGRNMDHFCLRIDPFDETAIRAHLAAFDAEPGPVEQRYGAEGTGPSIYLSDPEGNRIELKGPTGP